MSIYSLTLQSIAITMPKTKPPVFHEKTAKTSPYPFFCTIMSLKIKNTHQKNAPKENTIKSCLIPIHISKWSKIAQEKIRIARRLIEQ
ncbi:MAG: hypothetical protein ACJAXN_002836 [Psychromonas sp.]|jgi:hypothetical protein